MPGPPQDHGLRCEATSAWEILCCAMVGACRATPRGAPKRSGGVEGAPALVHCASFGRRMGALYLFRPTVARLAYPHQSVCKGAIVKRLGPPFRCGYRGVRCVWHRHVDRPDCYIVQRVIRWRSAAGRGAMSHSAGGRLGPGSRRNIGRPRQPWDDRLCRFAGSCWWEGGSLGRPA